MNKALLVMDAQEDFIGDQRNKEKFDYDDVDDLINNINERISFYEENNYEVIYVTTVFPNNFFYRKFAKYGISGSFGAKIDAKIKIVSENYFEKQTQNAFKNKNLVKFINEKGITHIELVGVDGSCCIAKTAEGARTLNLKVNILRNSVGTAYPHKINKISKRLEQYGIAYI